MRERQPGDAAVIGAEVAAVDDHADLALDRPSAQHAAGWARGAAGRVLDEHGVVLVKGIRVERVEPVQRLVGRNTPGAVGVEQRREPLLG